MSAPVQTVTLFTMAEALMARLVGAMTSVGVSVPARQVLYMSPIPADCEQIAVMFSGYAPQPPWDGVYPCQVPMWMGQFSIAITRKCTPAMPTKAGAAPSAVAMTEAAQMASDDAEALLALANGLEGGLGPEFLLETPPPQGGMQSVVMSIQVPAFGSL
jgi:hypothetical protein